MRAGTSSAAFITELGSDASDGASEAILAYPDGGIVRGPGSRSIEPHAPRTVCLRGSVRPNINDLGGKWFISYDLYLE